MSDPEPVPISALQHYLYCPRQCALIHLEQQWVDNRQTAEGGLLHRRVDTPGIERRPNLRTVTAMPLASQALGITGKADMVEFRHSPDGECAFPIEYKRGRPKAHRADEVQLCAQALCLEEMLGKSVEGGALFYGKTRRRRDIAFDSDLRALTRDTIAQVSAMLTSNRTPAASYASRKCDACSLIDVCQPQLSAQGKVADWLRGQLDGESD